MTELRFEDCPSLRRLVTPFEARTLPIHNWFVYPHSFSPGLVRFLVDRFQLQTGDVILDPFVGAGTTLLGAKEQNLSGIGIDMLPVSVALSQVKTATYDLGSLEKDVAKLTALLHSPQPLPIEGCNNLLAMVADQERILSKAFDETTWQQIFQIRTSIAAAASRTEHHLFMLIGLISLLEMYSSTKKTGGWLKLVDRPHNQVPLAVALEMRLSSMLNDLKSFQRREHSGTWKAFLGDARELSDNVGTVTAVITSPPYLNRHDYTRVLSLELLVGFLNDYDELRDLRYSLLRSHVEAKAMLYPLGYQQPSRLRQAKAELCERSTEQRILRIVDGYFEDMFAVLRSVQKKVPGGGFVAFVLGNVRFSGVNIPVDEIVSELGLMLGLQHQTILVARQRNNSAQQMRDYGRDPARESIVIWRVE